MALYPLNTNVCLIFTFVHMLLGILHKYTQSLSHWDRATFNKSDIYWKFDNVARGYLTYPE
jgi:hypothetical protein